MQIFGPYHWAHAWSSMTDLNEPRYGASVVVVDGVVLVFGGTNGSATIASVEALSPGESQTAVGSTSWGWIRSALLC